MFPYIVLIVTFCIFSSCRDSGSKEESETIGQGRLYSLNHGTFRTCLASDNWETMQYGFDAIADQSDAYLSVENNNKCNSFLLLGAPNSISRYSVQSDNNAIGLNRSGVFTIPDPKNPLNDISAVRYTATSGSSVGSEKLTIYRKMEIKNDEEVSLETLIGADRDFWEEGWSDDPFKNPITLNVKIYNRTTLPTAYVYKLYGTTADVSGVEADVNKILAQAVCKIQAVTLAETWPYADKDWDLNGNGKLDIYCQAEDKVGEEFWAIKAWAKDLKSIWNEEKIGVAILEQAFEIHDNGGVPINGISHENFVVLPENVNNRNFCHEYLHCDLASDLKDINDEFNVMHETDFFEQNRLRYRSVSIVTGAGGSEKQWDKLSSVSY